MPSSTRAAGLLIGKDQGDGIIIDVFGTIRKTLVSLASYQNKPRIAIGTRAATAVENRDT